MPSHQAIGMRAITFFDSPKVKKKVDFATRRVLSKFGAYVRTTAMQSMKAPRRLKASELNAEQREQYESSVAAAKKAGMPKPKLGKASSAPGEPPRAQTKKLKRAIRFGYDFKRRSVVVGPVLVAAKSSGEAPKTLEEGGRANMRDRRGRRSKVTVEPRPYMGPARDKNLPKLKGLWRNSVKR